MALPVNFDADSAARIYRAVRVVESGGRDQKPLTFARVMSDGVRSRAFRLARFSGTWATNTDQTVKLNTVSFYGTGNTLLVRNLFFPLNEAVTNISCGIARSNGSWLLVSVPFETAESVGFYGTTAMLLITPADTVTATFLVGTGATSTVSLVTGASATLNTADCSIVVSLATSTFEFLSAPETALHVTISTACTTTAYIATATFTQSYLKFATQ